MGHTHTHTHTHPYLVDGVEDQVRARRETPGARVECASTRFRMQNKLQAFLVPYLRHTLRGGGPDARTAREAMRAE